MTRMRPQPLQPSRNSVSPLTKAAKPSLKPNWPSRTSFLLSGRRHIVLLSGSSGGWRRRGDHPLRSCRGWWVPCRDRTRRPELPRRTLHHLHRNLRARLSRLSRPPSLPSRIKRHLPHLAHPRFRCPRNHQRLVDPRLELPERGHVAPRHDPILRVVPLRFLDKPAI